LFPEKEGKRENAVKHCEVIKVTGYATRFATACCASSHPEIDRRAIAMAWKDWDSGDLGSFLAAVYHLGQNDFQRRNCPSLSAGDVVRVDMSNGSEQWFRCCGDDTGWARMPGPSGVTGYAAEQLQPGEVLIEDEAQPETETEKSLEERCGAAPGTDTHELGFFPRDCQLCHDHAVEAAMGDTFKPIAEHLSRVGGGETVFDSLRKAIEKA
jgi:hypothetical protein